MTTDDDEKRADPPATDPNALVQSVLRESYLQTTEDLRYYAEKVRYFNKQKKAIRDYLNALRDVEAEVRSDPCAEPSFSREEVAKLIQERAQDYPTDAVARDLCIPERVPPASVTTLDSFAAEIRKWEERLNSLGDDAQLANVDLQNILQKQQQTLQMMSNISKMLHDTATAVIRKIGG